MRKIKAIEINLPMKEDWYAVGNAVSDTSIPKGKNIVTEIRDATVDGEDVFVSIYHVYVSGQLYKAIESSPVSVTYFMEGESIETN